jgi:transcription initiation factor TFIIE subunit alpha
MSIVDEDLMKKVANIIGGEDAMKTVVILKELGEATDDQILSKTDIKLNDVRKALFKLYNHSIVQCDRLRDEKTGWFIFRWKLQPDQLEGYVKNQKNRVLKILKNRLEYEQKNDFYYCGTSSCDRIIFEDAMEIVFRCPVCGNPLKHYDNAPIIKALAGKVEQLMKDSQLDA